jgi:ABC-type dipeptide/oligopeptide/nickel transport system permease subunit
MKSQEVQLREIAALVRLRRLRTLALGLGVCVTMCALGVLGIGRSNPEAWGSAYVAFGAAGKLAWAFWPLLSCGLFLICVSLVLQLVIVRRE